jgi:single-stranded DNA-binding protein
MQVFGNVASQPERKQSKSSGKGYFEFRLAESQRGVDTSPTWYTVRVMKDENPMLDKGDFVKVTGKLKADFYLNREGKPTGSLLIIAFEASKIAKPAAVQDGENRVAPAATKVPAKVIASESQQLHPPERAPKRLLPTEHEHEYDWTTLYG